MSIIRWSAGAVIIALSALLPSNAAFAGESPKRFKDVAAWEGEFTFSYEWSEDMDGVVWSKTYSGSGSIHISDPDIARRKDRLKWSGKTLANFNGRVTMEGENEEGAISAGASGSENVETYVSLGIRVDKNRFEFRLGKMQVFAPFQGTITDYQQDPPETASLPGEDTAFTIISIRTGRQPLPESGMTLTFSGEAKGNEDLKLTVTLRPAGTAPKQPPPSIALDAPKCSCKKLTKDETPQNELTITATAAGVKPGEGKFEKFEISHEGPKPDILSQTLGDTAEIKLRATETTGPITVKAVYRTRDGKRYYSEARRVQFCFLREIELIDEPHNDTDYAFNVNAELRIEANAEMWLGGKRSEYADIEWDIEKISESELTKKSGTGFTDVRLKFKGLPLSNSEFGPKKITAKPADAECECEQEKEVRAFFPPAARNHPGKGVGQTPNWFYYWEQTSAKSGLPPTYGPGNKSCGGGPVAGQYVFADNTLYLTDTILTGSCTAPATGKAAKGFDCYAQTVRHENVHKMEMEAWYRRIGTHPGPIQCQGEYSNDNSIATMFVNLGKWAAFDQDRDLVPDAVEEELAAIGCDPGKFKSCSSVPAHLSVGDIEMNAYNVAWGAWPVCTNAGEDWSEGGKQWTKECP